MSIFHLEARIVSRSKGHNAVAKAAYNARARLRDEHSGEIKNSVRKGAVAFSGLFVPKNAPEWAHDREKLWNEVEKSEKRKDAQLAREIIVALPHELTDKQRKWLITDYVREQFMQKGMIADVNIHEPGKAGDRRNYHAHILLTMRHVGPEGFGSKNRDWNKADLMEDWREAWQNLTNRYLARFSPETKPISRHTLAKQEITDRKPTRPLGIKGAAMERKKQKAEALSGFREQGRKATKKTAAPKSVKELFKDQRTKITKPKTFTPYQLRSRKANPINVPSPVPFAPSPKPYWRIQRPKPPNTG